MAADDRSECQLNSFSQAEVLAAAAANYSWPLDLGLVVEVAAKDED